MRELAEREESSRFTKLHEFLKGEIQECSDTSQKSKTEIVKRIDQFDRDIKTSIEHSGYSLSDYIGELEDRLEKIVNMHSNVIKP